MPQAVPVIISAIATPMVAALGEGAAIATASFIFNTGATLATSAALSHVSRAGKQKLAVQERQASVTSLSLGEVPRRAVFGQAAVGGSMLGLYA